MIGHNYRMPELETAKGLVQLGKLPKILESRNRKAKALTEGLKDNKELQLPIVLKGYKHTWHVFTIRLKNANAAKRNKVIKRSMQKMLGLVSIIQGLFTFHLTIVNTWASLNYP